MRLFICVIQSADQRNCSISCVVCYPCHYKISVAQCLHTANQLTLTAFYITFSAFYIVDLFGAGKFSFFFGRTNHLVVDSFSENGVLDKFANFSDMLIFFFIYSMSKVNSYGSGGI